MRRIDPYAQKRSTPPIETRTFTDPSAPGETLTLTLQAQSNQDAYRAMDEANRIIETYVTGDAPFPAVGGDVVDVSESLARIAANLFVMQRKNPDETPEQFDADKYDTEGLIALSVTWEDAWGEIVGFSIELNQRYETDRKNALRAMLKTKSDLPSTDSSSTPST